VAGNDDRHFVTELGG